MQLQFAPVTKSDMPAIIDVMTRAFDDDTQKHLGQPAGGPPGYNNGTFFETWLFNQELTQGIKMELDGRLIGAAIVWVMPNRHYGLGTIFVDPDYQNKGYGRKFWEHIEASYPAALSWRLDTPSFATKNHHFYKSSCGFTHVDTQPEERGKWDSLVFYKELKK